MNTHPLLLAYYHLCQRGCKGVPGAVQPHVHQPFSPRASHGAALLSINGINWMARNVLIAKSDNTCNLLDSHLPMGDRKGLLTPSARCTQQ